MLIILKWLLYSLAILLLLSFVSLILLLKFLPSFGGKLSSKEKEAYLKSPNFNHGKFNNLQAFKTRYKGPNFIDNSIEDPAFRRPDFAIPFQTIAAHQFSDHHLDTQIFWIGHSSIFLKIEGLKIWIDPMFSRTPSPLSFVGKPRYSAELPFRIEDLDTIDAVLLTHDHYDHLDYRSINAIKENVRQFYCPLGMRAHLNRWGVANAQITELDWHNSVQISAVKVTFTPSHHYSGRSLNDRFESLWGGWVIKGNNENIYVSGDGGYGPHFEAIGKQYGPFDFAMIECGQYCKYWLNNHLFPEQTAQVGLDVAAKIVMPIHWGAFTLAFHAWDSPVERLLKQADTYGLNICTPLIGQAVNISQKQFPNDTWWRT
jgi:L-ascorbate metabolism protein UlaG (beta-lactamase superfamily)